jgi:hypothetical protein
MKTARFGCLFAVLISTFVLAQSKQPHKQLTTQQPQTQVPHSPQKALAHEARAFKEKANRPKSASSVINFVFHGTYDPGGWTPTSVMLSDVNGDGKADIVVSNRDSNDIAVLLGNGDGTFQSAVTYSSGDSKPISVAVADVNGDGKPDAVVANSGGDDIAVLLGNGDGTFQKAATYGSGGHKPGFVAVADVNGDGRLDVVVANECSDSSFTVGFGTVGVLLGNGDGTFQTAVTYGSGGGPTVSLAVADVNSDGKFDIVVANYQTHQNCQTQSCSIGVLLGNGNGTFQPVVTYDSGGFRASSIGVTDVNGERKPDIVVSNLDTNDIGVLLGNGDGTFQQAITYGGSNMYLPDSVTVIDVNGDGKPDIVVADYCDIWDCKVGLVSILLGNGDGTFQTEVIYGSGGDQALSVAVADLNGDGRPDVVVSNGCDTWDQCNHSTIGVLINTSLTPTTTALTSSPNPSNFGQAVTFTATVTVQPGFYKGVPTGTVTFYDGSTNIGNSPLDSNGVAILTTSKLTEGTHSMTATYSGDKNCVPSTSPALYQTVQEAIAQVSPTSLDFGNQTVAITSSPQIVTLTNIGNINLTITSIQITGSNNLDFAQTNNCPNALAPNGSCQISVTFTPTTTGIRNAGVTITDNALDSPQTVSLKGVGVLPAVTFSPTRLLFSTQLIFTSSKAQPVQLTNTGLGVLLISKISVTGQFSQTNNCPNSLNPKASCTINVKFSPTTKGVQHGAVNVADNAPGSPQQVPLTGTATYVQLVPSKVNFGTQPLGTRSLPKTITLLNKGDGAVNIRSILVTGADSGDFAQKNNCGKRVRSGGSCFIKVTFKPQKKGARTADVSVSDDGGGSPQKASLKGTGT